MHEDLMNMNLFVSYLDEYVIDEGIQRFILPKSYRFICTIGMPHFVESEVIYQSEKKKGTFVLCPKHHNFIDVSVKKKVRV